MSADRVASRYCCLCAEWAAKESTPSRDAKRMRTTTDHTRWSVHSAHPQRDFLKYDLYVLFPTCLHRVIIVV